METGIFCSVLILCSLLPGALMGFGLVTTAWMQLRTEIRPISRTQAINNSLLRLLEHTMVNSTPPGMTIEEEYGLWNVYVCVTSAGNYGCEAATFGDAEKQLRAAKVKSAQQVATIDMLNNLRTIRVFAMIGVVAAVLGTLMTCDFLRRSVEKTPISIGAMCACCWAVAFLMAIITVAVQAQSNTLLRNGSRIYDAIPNSPIKVTMFFPWSIMVYGIGGLFAGLSGLLVLVRTLCIRREYGNSTVKWTRLTSEAEVDLNTDGIDPPQYYDGKGVPR